MQRKLTTTKQDSSDPRIACFLSHADSKLPHTPHERVGDSKHQGTQSGFNNPTQTQQGSEEGWPTAVAASHPAGAFQSKWTRKTLPWNANVPATVVAPIGIISMISGREATESRAGQSQRGPCNTLSEKTAASTDPPLISNPTTLT